MPSEPQPRGNGASVDLELVGDQPPQCAPLARLQRGDAEASADLYDQFADVVNRVVWRVMGADPERDDLVQEVFVKALAARRSSASFAAVTGPWPTTGPLDDARLTRALGVILQ